MPPPLLAPEPYTIFLDESGDHSLAKIDPQYPLFGLAGVLMETAAHTPAAATLTAWKTGLFGADVCLHMQEITRNIGPFVILKNGPVRSGFWSDLQAHLDALDFQVICTVILKDDYLKQYGAVAYNPYHLTLAFHVERFTFEMEDRGSRAGFVAESRAPHLDATLQAEYTHLLQNGTNYVPGERFRAALNDTILFQPKQPEALGLQIADLAAGPICRFVAGKKRQQAVSFYNKMRRSGGGKVEGYGLKSFP